MEILYHPHHATISDGMQQRVERGLRKLEQRFGGPLVDATVRFERDGPTCRVELVLRALRGRRLVAEGEGRFFGPALAASLARLDAQLRHVKRTRKARARRTTARA